MKKQSEKLLVSAVSLGGILEWYEIGLYIYWPLIILGKLLSFEMPIMDAINVGLVIATGFIARPLGGMLFGRWGDTKGRKSPFAWSVLLVSVPSLLIAFLPSYMLWNTVSLVFFTVVKFLQGIPAGGELPGAICYLSENGIPERRRYLCSFTFVGPQIGLLLSLAVCLLLESVFAQETLMKTWWRMVFFVSGMMGICGFYLRRKLHDSLDFSHLKSHSHSMQHPFRRLFSTHAKHVVAGMLLSIFQVVTFCVLTIMPPWYYKSIFQLSSKENLIISSVTLFFCAVTLPLIGKISSLYRKTPLLEISAVGSIILAYPFYWSVFNLNLLFALCIQAILVVLYCIQAALLPSLIANLFPVSLRYTGIGCSFNIIDGIFWGLIPILAITLRDAVGSPASFVFFVPISAIIFLLSLRFFKDTVNMQRT
jgi:MFS family permease